MDEKWYITSNRWIREREGEAKTHLIMIMDTPPIKVIEGIVKGWTPNRKVICTLDFGYGRKDDDEIAAKISATPELIKAAELAISYDDAIQQCANDPEKMSSFCTTTGEDLDTLYLAWINASRIAIAKTKEIIPCLKK